MKIQFRNGSVIETINIYSENPKRSKRAKEQLKYYDKQLNDILKRFDVKWHQKIYLKFILPLKYKICRRLRIYLSSRHHKW